LQKAQITPIVLTSRRDRALLRERLARRTPDLPPQRPRPTLLLCGAVLCLGSIAAISIAFAGPIPLTG